ncbi:MAG: flippase-like domain-containing protein [Gemmatimonadaceae bacterium]|nr:flippase-like domain-containing protein [Gemmatimonadaceae bacterium]
MKGRWRSVIGIALSAVLLWWTLRDVSLATVWGELRHSNLPLFLLATLLGTFIFPIRALRWRTILRPIAEVPLGPLWRSTAIGMMVNNVVPARAGEIARAFALTREAPIPFSSAIASLAVDRVFDAVTVLLLAAAAMLDPSFPRDATIAGQPLSSWAGGAGVIVLLALASLYVLVFFPAFLVRLFELFARKVAPAIEERGRKALVAFGEGLSVLRNPKRFLAVLAWAIFHWMVNALAFWVGMKAVGIDVPYSAVLFIQALIALGVAVPSAPGFFGLFEKLAVVSLGLFAVGAPAATSWAIGYHILSFIPITVIGAFYFARLGMRFREIQSSTEGKA